MAWSDAAEDIPIFQDSIYDNPLNYFCCAGLQDHVSRGNLSSCPIFVMKPFR